MTKLRRQTWEAGVDLFVVKNSLFERGNRGYALRGDSGIRRGAHLYRHHIRDPSAPAKVLSDFLKEADSGKILGGALDGRFLEDSEVKELASLPPREVLLSRIVGASRRPWRAFRAY